MIWCIFYNIIRCHIFTQFFIQLEKPLMFSKPDYFTWMDVTRTIRVTLCSNSKSTTIFLPTTSEPRLRLGWVRLYVISRLRLRVLFQLFTWDWSLKAKCIHYVTRFHVQNLSIDKLSHTKTISKYLDSTLPQNLRCVWKNSFKKYSNQPYLKLYNNTKISVVACILEWKWCKKLFTSYSSVWTIWKRIEINSKH